MAYGFEEALAALMGRIDTTVRVSILDSGERHTAQVVDVQGTLTASWDPEVVAANGVGDAAIFRMAGWDDFALYLLRDDFGEAWDQGETLMIRTGGVTVAVGPPLGVLSGADPPE